LVLGNIASDPPRSIKTYSNCEGFLQFTDGDILPLFLTAGDVSSGQTAFHVGILLEPGNHPLKVRTVLRFFLAYEDWTKKETIRDWLQIHTRVADIRRARTKTEAFCQLLEAQFTSPHRPSGLKVRPSSYRDFAIPQ